jgi:hypothetical protein
MATLSINCTLGKKITIWLMPIGPTELIGASLARNSHLIFIVISGYLN